MKAARSYGSSISRSLAGPARPPMTSSVKARRTKCSPTWRRCAPAFMPESNGGEIHLWRAFVPRWAHAPLSGDGAGRYGGRWNPVGTPTIYAARELSTAWAEYNQGFVQHPALIAQLELRFARLADLTAPEILSDLGLTEEIHRCEWRDALDRGLVPE